MYKISFKSVLLILGLVVILTNCSENPNELRKVEKDELIQQIVDEVVINYDSIIIKNAEGDTLTKAEYLSLERPESLIEDRYVNMDGDIKMVVVREKTEEDEALIQEIHSKFAQAFENKAPVPHVKVDCWNLVAALDSIHDLDQGMRTGKYDLDQNMDLNNLGYVVSTIEQCIKGKMFVPKADELNTIWLVIQHSPYNEYREQYLPFLKEWKNKGYLDGGHIALMEDRINMNNGIPQIYGSQIVKNQQTDEWVVYDLASPESVDARRAAVGLEPLKDYAARFDVVFDVPQEQ
ncbi:MAG: hypothetical protein HKN09_13840 [Saprospiraceae bacterium]|nr:hypothetical protein [Saprospiraceae bacterium]